MGGSRSFLSVVVVTHGRSELLERCLASLLRAAESSLELGRGRQVSFRVEINGRDADALRVCERLAAKSPFSLEFRELEERLAPGEARNRAIEGLECDWVLFVDDDAYVDPAYFHEFLAAAARHPDAKVIGGPNLTPPGSSLFQRASGVALASRLATFFSSARYRPRGEERRASEEDLILCNLFVRREELGANPFPSDFLCGEENWFLLGLRERGVLMIYTPALAVWHERRRRPWDLARQVFHYGEGRARNLVGRPRVLRFPHLVPSLSLGYAAAALIACSVRESVPAAVFAPFAIYLAACLTASFVSARRFGEGPVVALLATPVFAIVHAFYGLGMLAGLSRELEVLPRRAASAALAALFGILFWIYWPLILADPVLERDDVRTLRYLRGFKEFAALARYGEWDKLVVYQPLRDASLLLDEKWKAIFGFGTFHLTNWLLWCGIVALAYAILRTVLRGRDWLPFFAAALFAVHPIATGSVGWLSARKHLLATLFALAATWIVVRYRYRGGRWLRASAAATILYVFSVLAHPIAILWPFWALYYARQAREARTEHGAVMPSADGEPPAPPWLWAIGGLFTIPLALAAAVMSFRYYRGQYVEHTLNLKFAVSPDTGAPISLLAHGRYLFNLLFPFRLGAVYYPGSTWNMIGLFAAPFVFAALLTGRRGRESWGWLAFYFFPLLPVTLVMTNVFVSDTYVLLPAFGLTVLIARVVDGWLSVGRAEMRLRQRAFGAAALLVFFLLAGLSRARAGAWLSDRELWTRTDEVESSPRSLAMRIRVVLQAGEAIQARELLIRLHEWDPGNADYPQLFARAIYLDPRLTDAERVDLLSRADQAGSATHVDAWFNYFFGATLARAGNFRDADDRYRVVTMRPEAFEDDLAVAAAEAFKVCRLSGATDCESRARELRARISASPVLVSHWDETAFRSRSRELDRTLSGGN